MEDKVKKNELNQKEQEVEPKKSSSSFKKLFVFKKLLTVRKNFILLVLGLSFIGLFLTGVIVKNANFKQRPSLEKVSNNKKEISVFPSPTGITPTQIPQNLKGTKIPVKNTIVPTVTSKQQPSPTQQSQQGSNNQFSTFRGFNIDSSNVILSLPGQKITIKNESTGEVVFQTTSSTWSTGKLVPGMYIVTADSIADYQISSMSCSNCTNPTAHSYSNGNTFYQQVSEGRFYGIYFKYIKNTENGSNTSPTSTTVPTSNQSADIQPPNSSIISPNQDGGVADKSSGKSCIAFAPPADNVTPFNLIQTSYSFDGGAWSDYATYVAQACADLSSGTHTIQVRSKDQAGNVESPKSRTFIVQ